MKKTLLLTILIVISAVVSEYRLEMKRLQLEVMKKDVQLQLDILDHEIRYVSGQLDKIDRKLNQN